MTTRDKVEAWLKSKPEELILVPPVEVEKRQDNLLEMGKVTPTIIDEGYEITMNFRSATWEEED